MASSSKKKDTAAESEEAVTEEQGETSVAEPAEGKAAEGGIQLSEEMLNALIAKAVNTALTKQKQESDARIADLEKELGEAKKAQPAGFNGDVTLVYLSDSPGILNKVPGLSLRCGCYGEEFTLSRHQFDAVVGQYRDWFKEGILAVSRDNIDVAAKKGLKTQDEYYLKPSQLQRLGTMPVSELEKVWRECKNDNERLCIVTYYKRKFIEGKEPGYHETGRVLAMNTLTQQGLKREALEISGASLKITPTDFMDY